MKLIPTLLFMSVIVSAEQCGPLLKESLMTTSLCLAELERNQESVSQASLFSDEKIAAIMDTNSLLKEDNLELQKRVRWVNKERSRLKKELKSLKAKNIVSNEQIKKLKFFTSRQIEKIKPSTRGFQKNIASRSKELKKENVGLSRDSLFKKNIYVVSSFRSNVRFGPSVVFEKFSIAKKGDYIEFDEVYVSEFKKRNSVWLRTKQGWMYIPDKADRRMLISLNKQRDGGNIAKSNKIGLETVIALNLSNRND